jgi:ferredoxin
VDVLVRILGLQEQQLRDDQVGHVVLDRTHEEDHPLLEQARVDVVGAFAAGSLLDHHRHEAESLCIHCHFQLFLSVVLCAAGCPTDLFGCTASISH